MPPSRAPEDSTSPIGPSQRRLANALIALLAIAAIALTPVAAHKLAPLPTYMLAFGSAMLITNLLLSGLLFSRGASERSGPATRLGSAYFFVAVIFVPMMSAFPDAIVPGSLIGSKFSSVWIWSFWHAGFGLLVLRYVLTLERGAMGPRAARVEVLAALVLVALVVAASTTWIDHLPDIFTSPGGLFVGWGLLPPLATLAIDGLAFVLLKRLRQPTPDQLWLAVGMAAACFDVWLTMRGGSRFTVGWYLSKLGSLFTTGAVLISMFSDLTRLYRSVSESNARLADQAHRDGLTGIANRRRFDAALDEEWARAGRGGYPLSLLMIDVDWFKPYNDLYGHLQGDECLRRVAIVLEQSLKRPADLACRYGGEEFALLLPMTPADGALQLAAAIRQALASAPLAHGASPIGRVTVSIGVAGLHLLPGLAPRELVAAADRALYLAKQTGRDRARAQSVGPVLEQVAVAAVA